MVFNAGSVKDENSLSSPIVELLSSVVRRIKGKSANRKSGTDSKAPTKREPRPSNTPRKDRLLSRGNSDEEVSEPTPSLPPANSAITFLGYCFFGNSRIYATNLVTSSGLIFAPKAG